MKNITDEQIDKWVKNGDIDKLQDVVLDGKADKLKGKTSWNEETRNFLRNIPQLQVNYNQTP